MARSAVGPDARQRDAGDAGASSRSDNEADDPTPPELAGFWIRAAAAAIDVACGFAATLLLSKSVGVFFARRAVVTLRIGDPHSLWKGPIPFMLGMVGEVVYLIPFVFLLVWAVDPVTGATIGKRAFGLRVRAADGRPARREKRWLRFGVETVGLWGWTFALLAGEWQLALLASAAGAAMLAGSLVALGPRSVALHDRLSGTMVVRVRLRPEDDLASRALQGDPKAGLRRRMNSHVDPEK